MISFEIFLIILIISLYVGIILFLNRKGVLERYNISLYGPFLMIRTEKGKDLIYRLSRKKRFWIWFGNISIVVCFITMVAMVLLLLWQFWWLGEHMTEEVAEKLPGVNMVLIIPGINPILPIGYTIIAIIVAIVFHEFSHGISGASQGLEIKSMGILAFIFPVGAFVEPDEEELKKLKIRKRMKVFASGPAMNLLVSIVCLLIFSFTLMNSVSVAADGVGVGYIVKDSPAQRIGLETGSIILEINGSKISNMDDFFVAMNRTCANQTVSIEFYKDGKIFNTSVKLADKYMFTKDENDKGKGFLGVGPTTGYKYELSILKNPFNKLPDSFFYLYAMPLSAFFRGYNPITEPYTKFYEVKGIFASSPDVFWSLANAIYWIFWLNLAVGLFNVLPMIPLDGGYLMQDVLDSVLEKFRVKKDKKEKITKVVMTSISLLILFLVIYPLLLKYAYSLLH